MFNKKTIVGGLAGLGFLLGVTTDIAVAQMPAENSQQFRRIEQPLELKVGVTVGGIALIGLELWWFLWSKTKSQEKVK